MQTRYEELNAIISVGYDYIKETRDAIILAKDGVAEKYLRANGSNHLAEEIGLHNTVDHPVFKRFKYKQNVYRVSATIEIIDGEFGDMSQIVISEPMLAESQLYV